MTAKVHTVITNDLIEQTMDSHKLSLGTAIKIEPDIAEIIVDEGVVLNIPLVNNYHDWVKKNLPDPCFLLINKKHSFEYTFKAQIEIGTLRQIKAAAFYAPEKVTYQITDMLAKLPRKLEWNCKIFRRRDEALSWLRAQRRSH